MKNLDNILKEIQKILDTEINLFNSDMVNVVKKVQKLLNLSGLSNLSEQDILNFDYQFQQILTEAGYYNVVNNFINDSYDKTYSEIKSMFEATGLSFAYTEADIQILQDLKKLDLEFFSQIGNNASSQIKRDLFKYSLSNLTSIEMAKNIKQSLQSTELAKYSKTYAETAISNYNQSIIDIKSEGVENEVYIYRGVDDSKNRPFCQCLLDQHKSYNKVDAMSIKNDKRRRYNCRHLIIAVSKEWADENGYTIGNFSC